MTYTPPTAPCPVCGEECRLCGRRQKYSFPSSEGAWYDEFHCTTCRSVFALRRD